MPPVVLQSWLSACSGGYTRGLETPRRFVGNGHVIITQDPAVKKTQMRNLCPGSCHTNQINHVSHLTSILCASDIRNKIPTISNPSKMKNHATTCFLPTDLCPETRPEEKRSATQRHIHISTRTAWLPHKRHQRNSCDLLASTKEPLNMVYHHKYV